jgi:hypothetical protein
LLPCEWAQPKNINPPFQKMSKKSKIAYRARDVNAHDEGASAQQHEQQWKYQ